MADHIEVLEEEQHPTDRSVMPRAANTDAHSRSSHFGFHWLRRILRRSSTRQGKDMSESDCNCVQNGSIVDREKDISGSLTNGSNRSKRRSRWRIKRRQSELGEQSDLNKQFALQNPQQHSRISWSSFKKSIKRIRNRSTKSDNESNITVSVDGQRLEDSPILKRSNENTLLSDDCEEKLSQEKKDEYCIPRMICKVINCPWYWGNIDRFEAALALQTKTDGYFLLRKSAHPDFLFTISFKRFNTTMHVRIESGYDGNDDLNLADENIKWIEPGRFTPTYSQLVKLIDTCCKPYEGSIYNMPLLVCPLKRTNPLTLKELARAEVYNIYDYSGIESLDYIPQELKVYAKEYRFKIKYTHCY